MNHVIGAQSSFLPTARVQLPVIIEFTLENLVAKHYTRKVRTNLEGEAHRAATFFGSVGLKHHVVVHLQRSFLAQKNLSAGLGVSA